jgi:hypothetical protein
MRLRHFYIKVGLFGLLLLFCILFGVSLASSGMDRIEGSQPSSTTTVTPAATKLPGKVTTTAIKVSPTPTAKGAAAKDSTSKDATVKAKQSTEVKAEPVAIHDNSLNHVGNKLGDLLQIIMHHGIKIFVSLFDAVLGKG